MLDENGKPKETATVQAPDTPPVRKGDMVHLAVGALNGFYIVKSVQHDADSGKMTMQVEKADTTQKKTESKKKTYKVGDVVNFHGGKHYISSYPGAKGYNVSAGRAKITIANGSGKAHPCTWYMRTGQKRMFTAGLTRAVSTDRRQIWQRIKAAC